MERTCFNPEAAAFSPVFSSPPPQDIALALTTSPTPPQEADTSFAMAPMFNREHFSFYVGLPTSNIAQQTRLFMTPEALMHCTAEIHSHQRRFAWRISSHQTIQIFRLSKHRERQSQQRD